MGRLIQYIAYFLLLTFALNSFGQSQSFNTFPAEDIKINTNTNLLISGENLYFNLWCLNKTTSELSFISKMAYVMLINSEREIIINQKIRLENGLGSGTIYLPSNLKTGQYKLIYYTKWMLNNVDNPFNIQNIYIVSPYLSSKQQIINKDNEVIISKQQIEPEEQITNNGIQIFSSSIPYKTRSLATFELENLNQEPAYLSISVRKIEDVFVEDKTPETEEKNLQFSHFYVPELRGEIISGKVIDKTLKMGIPNKAVSLSITGNHQIFKIVKTNTLGEFYFNLHESYQSGELIIQVIDPILQNFDIIKNNFEFPFLNTLEFNEVQFNSEIKDWLLNRSIQSQIENAYFQFSKDSIEDKLTPYMLFGNPNSHYVLDEYTSFSSMDKILIEVLENVGVKKSQGERRININPIDLNVIYTSDIENLVVIDGIPILNHENLFQLQPEKINTISIYTDLFFYGHVTFDKIFLVNTKKNDFILPNNEPQYKENIIESKNSLLFSGPDYTEEKHERIPDLRTQLFWLANTVINEDKKSFNFYTSDVAGLYEITVKGFLKNGQQIKLIKNIEVK